MGPSVKSIPADAWQVRERIPPRPWGESTVEGRVEGGHHGHAYPKCCLDAFERGTIVERREAFELAQVVQERYVYWHHVRKPISAVHHSMSDGIGCLVKRLQRLSDGRSVTARDFYGPCLQALHSCLPRVEELVLERCATAVNHQDPHRLLFTRNPTGAYR